MYRGAKSVWKKATSEAARVRRQDDAGETSWDGTLLSSMPALWTKVLGSGSTPEAGFRPSSTTRKAMQGVIMTDNQQLFCDSLIDELADKLDLDEGTIGQEQIREVVERRMEAHDAEALADWKRDIKRSFDGFVDRL